MRPWPQPLVDAGISLGVLAVSWPGGSPGDGYVIAAGLASATSVPLVVRGSHPVPVAVVILAATVGQFPAGVEVPSMIGLLFALYTCALLCGRTISLGIALGSAALLVCVALLAGSDLGPVTVIGLLAGLVAAAWAGGSYQAARRHLVETLRARAEQLTRERDLRAEMAVAQERAWMAGELHDVIGHTLTVVIVQAEAAASVLPADPDGAREALLHVVEAARGGLHDVRALARHDPRRPAASGAASLEDLVGSASRTGLAVTLTRGGTAMPPAPIASAVFRIVQECLTNARKHADPGAAMQIDVTTTADAVTVTARSGAAGRGPDDVPADHQGMGLAVMRARVDALSGTLTHGFAADQFVVCACLPAAAHPRLAQAPPAVATA